MTQFMCQKRGVTVGERVLLAGVFTCPRRDTARQHEELWFTPLQLLDRGQPRGREIAPAIMMR